MGNQRPTNESIRIGSIFRHNSDGECGSSCSYYQVVGLRGKTLVELRAIRAEDYVDERCVKTEEELRRFRAEDPVGRGCIRTEWDYLVWRRPLPGQFKAGSEPFTVRALEPRKDGGNWLRRGSGGFWDYYWEAREDDESKVVGYDGGYARIALKKEGKLPSWAEVP